MRDCGNVFVQVFDRAAGLAIPENGEYRFVAARRWLRPLEKHRYRSVDAIENAARSLFLQLFLVETAEPA
jgi:hypothetical protein